MLHDKTQLLNHGICLEHFYYKAYFSVACSFPPQTHKANGKRNKNGKKLLLLTYTVWGIGQNAALYDCCNYQDH